MKLALMAEREVFCYTDNAVEQVFVEKYVGELSQKIEAINIGFKKLKQQISQGCQQRQGRGEILRGSAVNFVEKDDAMLQRPSKRPKNNNWLFAPLNRGADGNRVPKEILEGRNNLNPLHPGQGLSKGTGSLTNLLHEHLAAVG
jgi:hypothetical protein